MAPSSEEHSKLRRGGSRWLLIVFLAGAFAAGTWIYLRWQVPPLAFRPPLPPSVHFDTQGHAAVRSPGSAYTATVATFQDELFAYLMYAHLSASPPFQEDELLLCYFEGEGDGDPHYEVILILSDDFIGSINRLAELHTKSEIPNFAWNLRPAQTLTAYRNQTRLFVSAYNLPVRRKVEDLSKAELRRLVNRFIRFKSRTDPRIRKRIEPVPAALSSRDAQQLAGDIIAVADFFDLPLEFLLGIGAMENNYMNVRGDLEHSIWKRRPAKDDIILERRRGRVRVLNDSAGVWQITRETLRYAHQLYLKDGRDYCKLPKHLRPSSELDVNDVDHDTLTTYAGLLLRDLLDHFDGDIALAVGAYNGGPRNPNMRYHAGVQAAADHARKILERAAALNGQSVLQIPWMTSR